MSVTDSSEPADSVDSEASAASATIVEGGCELVGAGVEVGLAEDEEDTVPEGMAVDSVASEGTIELLFAESMITWIRLLALSLARNWSNISFA
jgi:hypothetical protein